MLGNEQKCLPSFSIKANELHYFNKLTNKNEVAQYTVVTAIYTFLLNKLILDFDGYIVTGSNDKNRPLLLSCHFDLKLSFKEYLQKVKAEILETLKYSDSNNEIVAKKRGIEDLRPLSNYSININSSNDIDCNGILFDLKINEDQDFEIQVHYLEGFVDKIILELLIRNFNRFIVDLENNIEVYLSEYDIVSEKERLQLLLEFNDTKVDYPSDKTIVDLFEEQVERTPNNIAVVFEGTELTYKELNEKSNQLAFYISSAYTINKEDIIGVFLPKSDSSIIALLAILKLGAVYLPIDTHYPQERIDFLIQDSSLKLLIADNSELQIDNCDIVNIKSVRLEDYSTENINIKFSSQNLAYIIYTSGSTGEPKGVMIEHTSNVNMILHQIQSLNITDKDRVVWFASVAFDVSVYEIMMSLYSGAALCISTEETIKDKDEFVNFLKVTKSSVLALSPSYLALLSKEDISGLRCITTGGELPNVSKALEIVELGIDYYNDYGPTECSVCVSSYRVTETDSDRTILPIGQPISNTQIYVLDDCLNLLPVGVTGKLYISGAGLGRGY
ncbi:AMP-binding protein, partial [Flavobacterium sp. JAS]|uniref:AMP-binding protein n=1 Tax=Flavobacterium sp. JAS TaxID=2897329 RepID=UPI001E375092